jgi:hypothetical protein
MWSQNATASATFSNANWFIVLGGNVDAPTPRCAQCNVETRDNIEKGNKPICRRCAFVMGAPKWLEAAFVAVGREQAGNLYRHLAAVFHPDTGGDERLMKALNAAKERFIK